MRKIQRQPAFEEIEESDDSNSDENLEVQNKIQELLENVCSFFFTYLLCANKMLLFNR